MVSEEAAMNKKAVTLLSGGMDSTVTLAEAIHEGFQAYALSFDYGQRHGIELESAKKVAAALAVFDHLVLKVDFRAFGASALTANIDVPKRRSLDAMSADIPVTYVPARNTVFLALAASWAESLGAADLFIGVNALDYSGYPDCRPEFIEAFTRALNLGLKAGVQGRGFRIHTPLISMTKRDIVLKGIELGVDFSLTHSCYDPLPGGAPCAECDACLLRLKGFREAGLEDPLMKGSESSAGAPHHNQSEGACVGFQS
jgi:7-cyano-7-deazaguanine synthase